MRSLLNVLLALFVVGAGFDRFDILQGGGTFSATPAVLLSPVLMVVWVVVVLRGGRARAPALPPAETNRRRLAAVLLVAFLALAALSDLFASAQAPGSRRVALLALIMAGGCACVSLARMTGSVAALRTGAWLGLVLTLGIDLLQVQAWLVAGPAILTHLGPVNITAPTYGLFAPRPSGLSNDPDRGAFLIALFYYLLTSDVWTRSRRMGGLLFTALTAVAAVTVLATFSRTGILVFVVVVFVALRTRFGSRRGLVAMVFGTSALLAGVGLAVSAIANNGTVGIAQLLDERTSISGSDSGGIHFELFAVAYRVLAADPRAVLTGIGFGNSPNVLGSVFNNNPGANFHSFYATAFVEMGIGGLAVVLVMLLAPLRSARVTLALVTAGFNFLYQANLDASFWLVIGLLWFGQSSSDETFETVAPKTEGAVAWIPRPRATTAGSS